MTDAADHYSQHISVGLTHEQNLPKSCDDSPLGIVTVDNVNTSLATVRDILMKELPALPAKFQFVTESGYPILKSQETTIRLRYALSKNHNIRIQTWFKKPKLGVKMVRGQALGFVFVQLDESLQALRNEITSQLGDLRNSGAPVGYQFVDSNTWPVSINQEESLRVLDVTKNSCVRIFSSGQPVPISVDHIDSGYSSLPHIDSVQPLSRASSTASSLAYFAFHKTDGERNSDASFNGTPFNNKQVLISYVRREAASQALKLKEHLSRYNYSVYLDVHEIEAGEDWQDHLNFAVKSCTAFVALLTPDYGNTKWTNREVKFADILEKLIIPVSFLEKWPPENLGIQFATTQYVPAHPNGVKQPIPEAGDNEGNVHVWDDVDAGHVAKEIVKKLEALDDVTDSPNQTSSTQSNLYSCPAKLGEGFELLSQNKEGKPLIVISVHPEQRQCATNMRTMLEAEGYDVWCTLDEDFPPEVSDSVMSPPYTQSTTAMSLPANFDLASLMSQTSQKSVEDQFQNASLKFKERADRAVLVIVVLSKAFALSKNCKQHVFYCEQRKKIVKVKFEDFCMPTWMSMLIGTGELQNANGTKFASLLKDRVARMLREGDDEDDSDRQQSIIAQHVTVLKKKLPSSGMFVYIAGSTKFFNSLSENICKSLGTALAGLDNIHVVTGGFNGIGRTVAESYEAECKRLNKASYLWHILPLKDDQDRRGDAPQNEDYTFHSAPSGTTLFIGDSVRDRECIVAQIFRVCVLIEGGPGAAHEAEQFIWNDGIVVPVMCTGGAAGGKFNVSDKIQELPVGISAKDWGNLRFADGGHTKVAESVANIIRTVCQRRRHFSRSSSILDSPVLMDSQMSSASSFSRKSGFGRFNSVLETQNKRPTALVKKVTVESDDMFEESGSPAPGTECSQTGSGSSQLASYVTSTGNEPSKIENSLHNDFAMPCLKTTSFSRQPTMPIAEVVNGSDGSGSDPNGSDVIPFSEEKYQQGACDKSREGGRQGDYTKIKTKSENNSHKKQNSARRPKNLPEKLPPANEHLKPCPQAMSLPSNVPLLFNSTKRTRHNVKPEPDTLPKQSSTEQVAKKLKGSE